MSFTIKAFIALVIFKLISSAGLEPLEGEIQSFVLVACQIVAAAGIWYGRYRQGDINWYGTKKK